MYCTRHGVLQRYISIGQASHDCTLADQILYASVCLTVFFIELKLTSAQTHWQHPRLVDCKAEADMAAASGPIPPCTAEVTITLATTWSTHHVHICA